MQAGQEINDSRRDGVMLGRNLDRGFFGAVPITVSRDVPSVDGDPWHVGEGVELFGLCGVVHGWNKLDFLESWTIQRLGAVLWMPQ